MSREMTIMANQEMGRIAEAICQQLYPELGKAKCWVLISEDHKISLCHAVCPERRPDDALAVLYLDGRSRGALSADHVTPERQWQAGCRALWACA